MMMFARIVIGLMLASELFTEAFNLSLMTGSGRGEGQQHNMTTNKHVLISVLGIIILASGTSLASSSKLKLFQAFSFHIVNPSGKLQS